MSAFKIVLIVMLSMNFVTVLQNASALHAISLDDEEEDIEDVEDLLKKAKQKAEKGEYGSAKSLIREARKYGVIKSDIDIVYKYVDEKHQAYIARIEREEAEEQAKREAEEAARQAELAQERYDASGNKGGSLNCNYVSSNYALWNYCNSGSCSGFSSNYALYSLCQNNNTNGVSSNYNVWNYLENGRNSFSGRVYSAAEQNRGSFSDRKRFVIYYLNGYIYRH